jgi:hypothetical protein
MKSHGTSWNLTELHGIWWKVLEHGRIFCLLTNDYKWWHCSMYVEHFRSQQPVYKGSLPSHSDSSSSNSLCSTFAFKLSLVWCNDACKTRDLDLVWSYSEAYGSALKNCNLRSIDTYRSCTKGLQKTAYLHLGDCNVKYAKAMKGWASTELAENWLGSRSTLVQLWV